MVGTGAIKPRAFAESPLFIKVMERNELSPVMVPPSTTLSGGSAVKGSSFSVVMESQPARSSAARAAAANVEPWIVEFMKPPKNRCSAPGARNGYRAPECAVSELQPHTHAIGTAEGVGKGATGTADAATRPGRILVEQV